MVKDDLVVPQEGMKSNLISPVTTILYKDTGIQLSPCVCSILVVISCSMNTQKGVQCRVGWSRQGRVHIPWNTIKVCLLVDSYSNLSAKLLELVRVFAIIALDYCS